MEEYKELKVLYRGRNVGLLKQLNDGRVGFQYDKTWIETGFSISPLYLPLKSDIFISKSKYFEGLFGVFYDCLPDGWGIRVLIRLLAKKGMNYQHLPILTKLSIINNNGLGGLNFVPTQGNSKENYIGDYDALAKDIENLLRDEITDDDAALDTLYQLGGSSGGARPKAHVTLNDGEWIIKFPSSIDGENAGCEEYKANCLAKKAGIITNEFRLFPSNICKGYFGTKRFDRTSNGKVHMISLSSILETSHQIPNLDYIHLFQVTERICKEQSELYEVYRRMCFNVLFGNKDDHGKNFSFLYNEVIGSYTLSPFYDITKTAYKSEHEMTVLGNGKPTENDLRKIVKTIGLDRERCEKILLDVREAIENA